MNDFGRRRAVFSAHAEVVPPAVKAGPARDCILRARGGSSWIGGTAYRGAVYSPRTRR